MSNRLPIFNEKLSANAVLVYLYLDRHGARKNQCFHSIKTIDSNLNISERTVNRVINELEKNCFILRDPRYRNNGAISSNTYEILK